MGTDHTALLKNYERYTAQSVRGPSKNLRPNQSYIECKAQSTI